MMGVAVSSLIFKRLNDGWNAEPNAPAPSVTVWGSDVPLTFFVNPFAYVASEEERGCLLFKRCSMWRLGPTNDEGWCTGQCRYSKAAPMWGQFYELLGEDGLEPIPTDWHELRQPLLGRHFLFYLRDQTFECLAADWKFECIELAP
jgi:hypothetical protein